MQIETININELTLYEDNAKRHPKKQVEVIKNSIQTFGFNDPVLIDNNNMVISGHGRLKAARELNLIDIPCVRIGNLSEEEVKAFRLADNQITLETGWSEKDLNDEIKSLFNFNMGDFGFGFDAEEVVEEEPERGFKGKERGKGGDRPKKPKIKHTHKCPGCGHKFTPVKEEAAVPNEKVNDELDQILQDLINQ